MSTPEHEARDAEVDDLYARLEKLEEENRILRDMVGPPPGEFRPEDGLFKRCANRACPNKVQYGTRYCPPCREG